MFGSLKNKPAVLGRRDAYLELATVFAVGQSFRELFAGLDHVRNDALYNLLNSNKRIPGALFDRASGRPPAHKVLLPGVSALDPG